MQKTRKVLLGVLWGALIIALVTIVLFECDVIVQGRLAGHVKSEYLSAVVMELLTLVCIPLALWLFRWGVVKRSLREHKEKGLLRWGLLRLLILCGPMLVCVLLYYLYASVSFGYLGIILALCLFFVYPSLGRCMAEIES